MANVTTFNPQVTDTYVIDDMTSTGEMLKVPTETSGEYFLVSNRRRNIGNDAGYTWDCNMLGDTAMAIPFLQFNDYSKGLYIYHVTGGDDFQAWVDLEAADGLWNWEHTGTSTPDWSSEQTLPLLSKTGVGYNEDNPTTAYYYDLSRYQSRDGQSVISQNSNPYAGWGQKWFSIGQRHTQLGEQGTDRIFTNETNDWCSREEMGDRWDGWALGYNVIFSPYSSPNTKDRNNNSTGIFIYYTTLNGTEATIRVYQADANTSEEEDVLEGTPPSRPMLFKIEAVECNDDYARPKITWENNKEPDMLRSNSYKRYYIYRAYANQGYLPVNYQYLATYDDYTPNDTASYIDRNGAGIYCGGYEGIGEHFRYKVIAVDKYEDQSVFSDFASTLGLALDDSKPHSQNNNENPVKFNLSQNYPNPFNPVTEINYSIPYNTKVTLKVFNLLGQEIAVLVNEYKGKGNHTVFFDGSELPSGVYIYTIEAGFYKASKKMVLIK